MHQATVDAGTAVAAGAVTARAGATPVLDVVRLAVERVQKASAELDLRREPEAELQVHEPEGR